MIFCDECDLSTDDVETAYQCQTCFSMLHPECIADHCRPDRPKGVLRNDSLVPCDHADVRLLRPSGPALTAGPATQRASLPAVMAAAAARAELPVEPPETARRACERALDTVCSTPTLVGSRARKVAPASLSPREPMRRRFHDRVMNAGVIGLLASAGLPLLALPFRPPTALSEAVAAVSLLGVLASLASLLGREP